MNLTYLTANTALLRHTAGVSQGLKISTSNKNDGNVYGGGNVKVLLSYSLQQEEGGA